MVKDLIANAAILIAFISITNQIIKNSGLNDTHPMAFEVLSGIVSGVLGILLIVYSVHVADYTIADFRYFAIIISTLCFGFISASISVVLIGLFRFLYYGVNLSSTVAFIGIAAIGTGCIIISRVNISSFKKWVYSVIYCLLIYTITFSILVSDHRILLKLLVLFYMAGIFLTFIIYPYVEYLELTNRLFKKFKEESQKDFLTGLINVREFNATFDCIVRSAKEKSESLSLLFVDIDYFKKVNDTYGHSAGDLVLKELGRILKEVCRQNDIACRHGGEEFSVLLPGCPSDIAFEIGERIRQTVESHKFMLPDGRVISITISIGASSYPDTTKKPEKLLEQADAALYQAKNSGRNKVFLAQQILG